MAARRPLYFAHGSSPSRPLPFGRAFLPDRVLARTDDGALDVVARPGHVVEGVLFDADPEASALVHRDPAPLAEALRADGTAVLVHQTAAGRPARSLAPAFFVYGTLMRDEPRHPAILAHTPEAVLPATCPGRLVDLGAYPGMLLASGNGRSTIHGELIRFGDGALSAAVTRLDAIEDFRGFLARGSLYLRRLVRVTRDDARAQLAWTYIYCGDARTARPIPSGDWRAHRRSP